jgi:hypothetical protein
MILITIVFMGFKNQQTSLGCSTWHEITIKAPPTSPFFMVKSQETTKKKRGGPELPVSRNRAPWNPAVEPGANGGI